MEARNRTLPDWLTRIRTRQIVLPRFQRFEAWSHYQVTGLLNTVIKGLPSGALLTLDVGENEPFLSRPISGAPENGERINEHLLDGQQRLTALWRSLNNNYDDRTYFIKIESDDDDESDAKINYIATSIARFVRDGQLFPLWANDPQELWARGYIPIEILRPDAQPEQWVRNASNRDYDVGQTIGNKIYELRLKFSGYTIPFLSLPATTKREVALDVFIQMNTSSSPLTAFDIVVAQLEAATNKSLHSYIEELKKDVPNIIRYREPQDTVLAVAALLQDKVPSKGTYLMPEFSTQFEVHWQKIKQGIKKAVSFLADEKIYDSRRLPTDVAVYVIAAIWANAPDGLDQEGQIRTLTRKYIWRAFFTDRYDRTSNSRAFSDYKELTKIAIGESGSPDVFNEILYPVADTLTLGTASWPYRKDRLARAILTVSLKYGGFDFADGAPASYENIQNREYHHIYPQAWLKDKEFKDHEINRALNCALISWRTNRTISANAPSEYIAERMEQSALGEQEVMRRIESHLVPYTELISNDFNSFICTRAELIKKLIDKLCNGEIVEGML